jgi:hypothetical protein
VDALRKPTRHALLATTLTACASILGIETPSPSDSSDAAVDDATDDAPDAGTMSDGAGEASPADGGRESSCDACDLVLASGQGTVGHMVVVGDTLFWSSGITPSSQILSCPTSRPCGAIPTLVDTQPGNINALVNANGAAGWGGTYGTFSMAVPGGPTVVAVKDLGSITAIAWPEGSAQGFLAVNSAIYTCSVPNCVATQYQSGDTPIAMAATRTELYWLEDSGQSLLWKGCDLKESPCTQFDCSACTAGALRRIAASGTHVAWFSNSTLFVGEGLVAGGPITLAGEQIATDLAMDDTDVVWAAGTKVMSCAIGGCQSTPTTVVDAHDPVLAIAIDSATVYYATMGGDVRRAPRY